MGYTTNPGTHVPNSGAEEPDMTQEHDSPLITDLLIKNEEGMRDLYLAYAEKYPQCEEFWSGLAVEESGHADWIRELAGQVREGRIHIEPGRFRNEAIASFTKYVQDELARAQREEMLLITALSIALSAEQTMIERGFFEIFDTDSAELKHVLHNIATATEEHIKHVEECWAEHR
jgi:rubrerythrin